MTVPRLCPSRCTAAQCLQSPSRLLPGRAEAQNVQQTMFKEEVRNFRISKCAAHLCKSIDRGRSTNPGARGWRACAMCVWGPCACACRLLVCVCACVQCARAAVHARLRGGAQARGAHRRSPSNAETFLKHVMLLRSRLPWKSLLC